MSQPNGCCCSAATKLVFACSGGADVGALADLGFKKGESPVTEDRVLTAAMAVTPHFTTLS